MKIELKRKPKANYNSLSIQRTLEVSLVSKHPAFMARQAYNSKGVKK